MKCPNCGKEIANDSQFCEFCGTQVASSKNVAQETSVHVRWLLLLFCFVNEFCRMFGILYEWFYSHFYISPFWIAPAISLILFIIGLILSIKKKLKGIYTIMLFLIFITNIVEIYWYAGLCYWFPEWWIMLIYLIIASVASIKEKKKN